MASFLGSFGSFSSSSSSSSMSSKGKVHLLCDKRFQQLAQDEQCPYSPLLELSSLKCSVYIQRKGYHWFIMVKAQETKLPYITIEITTPDLQKFVQVMDVLEDDDGKEFVGVYEGMFMNLCEVADKVIEDMGRYSLLSNNCQHFCNNIFHRLGLKTYPVTVGKNVTVKEVSEFDRFDQMVTLMGGRTGSILAKVLRELVGAPK